MGQMTIGILFGVAVPGGLVLYDDEDYEKGLLDRWQAANADAITARQEWITARVMSGCGKMPYEFESGDDRIVPDMESDSRPQLLGFWVCAGASGKNGLPNLHYLAVPLAAIRTTEPYARAYRNARRRWWRFVRWARTQGVDLPRPRLWITPTEVA